MIKRIVLISVKKVPFYKHTMARIFGLYGTSRPEVWQEDGLIKESGYWYKGQFCVTERVYQRLNDIK